MSHSMFSLYCDETLPPNSPPTHPIYSPDKEEGDGTCNGCMIKGVTGSAMCISRSKYSKSHEPEIISNSDGKFDCVRFTNYDKTELSVTIRVDDTRLPSFHVVIPIKLSQLQHFIEHEKQENLGAQSMLDGLYNTGIVNTFFGYASDMIL